jgi:uncharacterized protein YpuA (DUF1002 family)
VLLFFFFAHHGHSTKPPKSFGHRVKRNKPNQGGEAVDIGKLLSLVKSIPKEKLKTDAGLKEVIRDLGRKTGKSFTDQELNQYVAQFRRMARTEDVNSLMNKLAQKGVKPNDLNNIKKRLK